MVAGHVSRLYLLTNREQVERTQPTPTHPRCMIVVSVNGRRVLGREFQDVVHSLQRVGRPVEFGLIPNPDVKVTVAGPPQELLLRRVSGRVAVTGFREASGYAAIARPSRRKCVRSRWRLRELRVDFAYVQLVQTTASVWAGCAPSSHVDKSKSLPSCAICVTPNAAVKSIRTPGMTCGGATSITGTALPRLAQDAPSRYLRCQATSDDPQSF